MSEAVLTTGRRLRRWRQASGVTQEQAAGVFGCTVAAYSKWEREEVEPRGRDLIYARRVERVLARFEGPAAGEEGGE